MKQQILSRWDSAKVLFECELPEAIESVMRHALEKAATPEQAIVNLDKVREIILDNAERLDMGHWHEDDAWKDRTCAEETLCGTTHCLAGWLQVCSTDAEVRGMNTFTAGLLSAPVAAPFFYAGSIETLEWLKARKYAEAT